MVGTPNIIVAGPASLAPAAAPLNLPMWCDAPPRRNGPSTPTTSPCTWKIGSACVTTSAAVHSQAVANESKLDAMARRGSTTPLGGPVVPEV